jgi:hypothetical protein
MTTGVFVLLVVGLWARGTTRYLLAAILFYAAFLVEAVDLLT